MQSLTKLYNSLRHRLDSSYAWTILSPQVLVNESSPVWFKTCPIKTGIFENVKRSFPRDKNELGQWRQRTGVGHLFYYLFFMAFSGKRWKSIKSYKGDEKRPILPLKELHFATAPFFICVFHTFLNSNLISKPLFPFIFCIKYCVWLIITNLASLSLKKKKKVEFLSCFTINYFILYLEGLAKRVVWIKTLVIYNFVNILLSEHFTNLN